MRTSAAPWSGGIDQATRAEHGEVAGRRQRLRRVAGVDIERADAVAIEAKILVAGIGDQRLLDMIEDHPHRRRVLFEPVAEPLVGEIDERDDLSLGENAGDLAPLLHREIEAGGVVAAAVQQRHVAGLGA